jgi:hypothetical protein
MNIVEIIVVRAKNLRDLGLIEQVASRSSEPLYKVFLLRWRICLIVHSNHQWISISKSSVTLFPLHSRDICGDNNQIIRILR